MSYDYEPLPEDGEARDDDMAGTLWDQRQDIGLWPALWGSIKQIIQRPADFYAGVDPAAPIGPGLTFYLLVNVGVLVLSTPFQMATGNFSPAVIPVGLAAALVGLFVGAGIWHLAVRMLGGAGGFNGTLQVMMYVAGAGVFGIVPFAGGIIGMVFTIRAAIAGYEQVHGFTPRRAAAAYLLPMTVVILPMMAAIAIPNFLNAKLSANNALAKARLRSMSTAAETYRTAHEGRFPSGIEDLTGATPPYLSEHYCGREDSDFRYDCRFMEEGYVIEANPVTPADDDRAGYRISTGGELVEVPALNAESD